MLSDITALFNGLKDIDGINDVIIHTNCINRDNRYDLLIQIDMDKSILLVYDECSVHKTWKEKYGKYIDKKAIFDYE